MSTRSSISSPVSGCSRSASRLDPDCEQSFCQSTSGFEELLAAEVPQQQDAMGPAQYDSFLIIEKLEDLHARLGLPRPALCHRSQLLDINSCAEKLGEGCCGVVLPGRAAQRAVKVLTLSCLVGPQADAQVEAILQEMVRPLQLLGHGVRGIVGPTRVALEDCVDPLGAPIVKAYIEMEAFDCSVATLLLRLRVERKLLKEECALLIIKALLAAVAGMQDTGMMHSDIKPGNILVSCSTGPSCSVAKVGLCDFGGVKAMGVGETTLLPEIGTPWYDAPEKWDEVHDCFNPVGYEAESYSAAQVMLDVLRQTERTPVTLILTRLAVHTVKAKWPRARPTPTTLLDVVCGLTGSGAAEVDVDCNLRKVAEEARWWGRFAAAKGDARAACLWAGLSKLARWQLAKAHARADAAVVAAWLGAATQAAHARADAALEAAWLAATAARAAPQGGVEAGTLATSSPGAAAACRAGLGERPSPTQPYELGSMASVGSLSRRSSLSAGDSCWGWGPSESDRGGLPPCEGEVACPCPQSPASRPPLLPCSSSSAGGDGGDSIRGSCSCVAVPTAADCHALLQPGTSTSGGGGGSRGGRSCGGLPPGDQPASRATPPTPPAAQSLLHQAGSTAKDAAAVVVDRLVKAAKAVKKACRSTVRKVKRVAKLAPRPL